MGDVDAKTESDEAIGARERIAQEIRGPARPSYHFSPIIVCCALTGSALLHPGQTRPPIDQVTVSPRLSELVSTALNAAELPVLAAGLIDTIGGRLSGTAAGRQAEAWAAGWLRSFGFDSVWFEPVTMAVWRRGVSSVRVVAPTELRGREIVTVAYGYSPGITADSVPLIDIGHGDPGVIEAAGRAVRGAALLTDVVSPLIVELAARARAAALVRVSFEPGRLPQARVAPVTEPPAPLPILAVSREDGLWLRRQSAAGRVELSLQIEAETVSGVASNVVADLVGSDPSVSGEVFLLGAHLDAWDLGDGAIDNGSGVLVVMGAAQALAAAEARPRRSIRVVLFAGEELGLLGSRAYVQRHADGLGDVIAMMNIDVVGAPQGFGATGHPEADTVFARLAKALALRGLVLSEEVEHGGGAGSDHQPFLLAGVPTIFVRSSLSADVLRWYHNAGDTLDKIDLEGLRKSAAAAAAAAWELADHPGRPLRHLSAEETRVLVERLGWLN